MFQRDETEWIRVEESDMWNLLQKENSLLRLLRLSYRHLPFKLKRCFVYCAVFPKDYEFAKTEVIFHWMAHGCITSYEREEREDVGDRIWNELTSRSFFQVIDTRGGETTFKMYDLVHDFAQSIMENKISRAETERSKTSALNSKIREVRCGSKINPNSGIAVEVSKLSYIIKYNRLRTLKLCWATTGELPSAIGDLVLRWKGDSTSPKPTDDEKVLEALEPHPNLITLEIHGFRGRELALWMEKMDNLTRIFIRNCSCTHLSPLGDLPRLKYLHLSDAKALEYIVEESETPCTKFASLEALGLNDLPELKGWSKEEMVDMFPNLKRLGITSCDLSKLTPTSTCLSKLDFRNCKIESCFPERWLQKLHSLEELSVYECTELANVWAEEIKNLHRLRRLSIAYDHDLVSLPQVLQHIPSLRSLSLHGLLNLASMPDWLPNLASLTELNIEGCPVIPSLPSSIRGMTNLKRLSIKGCRLLGRRCEKVNGADWDKISHIPRLDI